jgi:glycerol-3-phosphate acyltransferase PlsY
MTSAWLVTTAAVGGYLIGSIPFGWLLARARGIDIMRHGSGNIGATNVGRILGRSWGVLVFALDFAKGAVPPALALLPEGDGLLPGALPVTAGIAAFLGHLFPVWLRFRGGKGVATGAGALAVIVPLWAAGVVVVWAVVTLATRYVSVGSLVAAVALVGMQLALTGEPLGREQVVVTAFCGAASALVFVRHSGNIRRLIAGTENRVGWKGNPSPQPPPPEGEGEGLPESERL